MDNILKLLNKHGLTTHQSNEPARAIGAGSLRWSSELNVGVFPWILEGTNQVY
jgi:hypothetical protein